MPTEILSSHPLFDVTTNYFTVYKLTFSQFDSEAAVQTSALTQSAVRWFYLQSCFVSTWFKSADRDATTLLYFPS